MRRIIYCMLIISLSHQAFSQCNIVKTVKDTTTFYSAANENLYKNEDLENGVRSVYGHLFVYCHKASNKYYKRIAITSGASGEQVFVFPRSLVIVFSNGSSITLKALSDVDLDIKGMTAVKCNFSLSDDDWKSINTLDINNIMIYDNRLDVILEMQPYSGIFQEQAKCITNEIGNSN